MELAAAVKMLDEAHEDSLAALGTVEPRSAGRFTPQIIGHKMVPWPYHALGRVRIIRREGGVLFATSGLSFPFDDGIHGPGRKPLEYELGIELPLGQLVESSAEALAATWPVRALLWLSACYLLDDFRLLDMLDDFSLMTQVLPPEPALARLVLSDGSVGALAGMPLDPAAPFGRAGQRLLGAVAACESRLIMLTAITPEETAWVRGVPDASRAIALARALWNSRSAHRTDPTRTSVIV